MNYIVLENNNKDIKSIYIYNDDYYFCFNSINNNIFIDKNSNTIRVKSITNDKNKLFSFEFNSFLISWDSIFFKKIRFTGKGFKFKKKVANLFLFFNRAHKCFFIGNNIILKRLSKNKIILLKNNYKHLTHDSIIIRKIRSINIFTKRGLRLSRQLVLKKKGKTASH